MTTQVAHDGELYQLVTDTIQGVVRWVRKSDGAVSLWDTGTEAAELLEWVELSDRDEIDEYAEDNFLPA